MTPAEQIAHVHATESDGWNVTDTTLDAILAVCDLAERALLADDETEAVRRWAPVIADPKVQTVLRRLLGE